MVMQTLLRGVVRGVIRPTFNPRVPIARQRKLLALATRLRFLPAGLSCETVTLGTVPAQRISVAKPGAGVLLYLHGGAYSSGSPETHRNLCSHLAQAAACTVYTLDYRLAPEHPFPAGLDDAEAAYRTLLAQGVKSTQIAIAGDSAGGGMALALAQRIRAAGLPAPALLYLLSPWSDLTFSGESIKTRAGVDPMVTEPWIRAGADMYIAGGDARDPLISPVFADYQGLPPMLVQWGGDEILYSDCQRVVERARAAGVDVEFEVFDGLWHVFQVFAGMLPAATTALREAAQVMQRRWHD